MILKAIKAGVRAGIGVGAIVLGLAVAVVWGIPIPPPKPAKDARWPPPGWR